MSGTLQAKRINKFRPLGTKKVWCCLLDFAWWGQKMPVENIDFGRLGAFPITNCFIRAQ